jgi:hypothetical protein
VLARLGRRDADRARERRVGQRHAAAEVDDARLGVDARDPQPRVGELVGQQAEAGDDRRPAPVARAQLEDLDGQRVAGPGAADEHRAGHRVHAREVERRDGGDVRIAVQLAARGVAHLELDDVAGLDLEHRRDRVVPHEVGGLLAHPVQRVAFHGVSGALR